MCEKETKVHANENGKIRVNDTCAAEICLLMDNSCLEHVDVLGVLLLQKTMRKLKVITINW